MAPKTVKKKLVATAKLRYTHVSAQKARLVVDLIRGKEVSNALTILRTSKKAVSRPIEKLLLSAVANAQAGGKVSDIDDLFVAEAFVDVAPSLKRIRARAMGRAFRVLKRFSHITVGLNEKTRG